MHNKGRAIEDFLACGEALKNGIRGEDGKLIKSSFLAAKAFSAGGVIVGAAVNMNPSLFDAISLTNPFLDVLNAMKDKSHYLTEHEWDEFGDPINDPRAFSSIQNYCPFHNLKSYNTRYPVMFIVGTRDDENVPYHHAVTYGMKVRGLVEDKGTSRNNAPVLLHIEQDGGHDLYGKRLQVSALETSFLLGRNGCASEHL
jgi:oligopeptidase B